MYVVLVRYAQSAACTAHSKLNQGCLRAEPLSQGWWTNAEPWHSTLSRMLQASSLLLLGMATNPLHVQACSPCLVTRDIDAPCCLQHCPHGCQRSEHPVCVSHVLHRQNVPLECPCQRCLEQQWQSTVKVNVAFYAHILAPYLCSHLSTT